MDADIARLPLRAEPLPYESINGFIAHLAHLNGFERPGWVAKAAGVTFPKVWYDAEDVGRLSLISGWEFSVLRRIAPSPPKRAGPWEKSEFLGHEVPTKAFVQNGRRACPQCLREMPRHRSLWDLRFVRTCVAHQVQLLAACPSCNRELDWLMGTVDQCPCGAAISEGTAPALKGKWHAAEFGSLMLQCWLVGHDRPIPELLTGMSFHEIFYVCSRLGAFGRRRGEVFTLNDSLHDDLGRWLSRGVGLAMHSQSELSRALVNLSTKVRGRPTKNHLRILVEVRDTVRGFGSHGEPLARILDGVLEEHADVLGRAW